MKFAMSLIGVVLLIASVVIAALFEITF